MEIIEWKSYIHLLDLTRNSCDKCNSRPLTGIEPAIMVQRSNQRKLHSPYSCRALTPSDCMLLDDGTA
jgi:hypothetical protein